MTDRMLGVAEAAKMAGVSIETVRRWIRAKKIKAAKPGGNTSPYRIPESEIRRVLSWDN